jgi:hypothetical protein
MTLESQLEDNLIAQLTQDVHSGSSVMIYEP